MITSFNLFNIVAWIVAGIVSAIISSLFLSKNSKRKINQLFSFGFIAWSFSLLFNGLNFAAAYKSLILANIFRDICVITGVISAFTLFLATLGIYFGIEKINWIIILVVACLAIPLAIIGMLNDWVVEDGFGGYKTTDNWLGKTCTQIIPAIFVVTGLILLVMTYVSLEKSSAKIRVGYFTIGFAAIILGLFMFVVDAIIEVSPYIFLSLAICTWVAGPILMLVGFYVKENNSPEKQVGIETLEPQSLDPKKMQKLERPS